MTETRACPNCGKFLIRDTGGDRCGWCGWPNIVPVTQSNNTTPDPRCRRDRLRNFCNEYGCAEEIKENCPPPCDDCVLADFIASEIARVHEQYTPLVDVSSRLAAASTIYVGMTGRIFRDAEERGSTNTLNPCFITGCARNGIVGERAIRILITECEAALKKLTEENH